MRKVLYAAIAIMAIFDVSEGMNKTMDARLTLDIPRLRTILPDLRENEQQLSPRSLYDRGLELLLHHEGEDKLYGAVLILMSAQRGCSTASEYFNCSCNIQRIEDRSDSELIDALMSSSASEDIL